MTEINQTTMVSEGSRAGSTAPNSPAPSNGGHNVPRYGTVIPNRIFVGGIAFNTSDIELKAFFSAFGHVKEVKIISDRAGVSKGYGFITFETQEEALRILKEQPNSLIFKDKKLNIGQAIRKQPTRYPKEHEHTYLSNGMVLQSPAGAYSYTYHNGVAYFNPGDPLQLVQGPAGHATAAALTAHHHPHAQQSAYTPLTVPVMLPPTSIPQFVTPHAPAQPAQLAYPQHITASPPWQTPAAQVRFIHPAQAAAVQSAQHAGLFYPGPAGTELIYTTTPPLQHQPVPHQQQLAHPQYGHHHTTATEPISTEVPIMESTHPETAVIPPEHQVPQTVIASPYPEMTYATTTDPYPHFRVPGPAGKFAGKRPITTVPRRERAAKTIRTAVSDSMVPGATVMYDHVYQE